VAQFYRVSQSSVSTATKIDTSKQSRLQASGLNGRAAGSGPNSEMFDGAI